MVLRQNQNYHCEIAVTLVLSNKTAGQSGQRGSVKSEQCYIVV